MADDVIGDMDLEYATAIADRAIQSMSQQSIPATPSNFSVWFDYAMGASPALRKTIDILIGKATIIRLILPMLSIFATAWRLSV